MHYWLYLVHTNENIYARGHVHLQYIHEREEIRLYSMGQDSYPGLEWLGDL